MLLHHTRVCVCLLVCLFACLRPYTVNFNTTKIEPGSAIAKVQCQLPGDEATEVEAHMATYSSFATDH